MKYDPSAFVQPTEADVGRRVIYDPRPTIPHANRGVITGMNGRHPLVLFDGFEHPLTVISNLRWADARADISGSIKGEPHGELRQR